jgi:hypothetical protein
MAKRPASTTHRSNTGGTVKIATKPVALKPSKGTARRK